MAFAGAFEFEDELELEPVNLEDEPGEESFAFESSNLLEFRTFPSGGFAARVSGFDWKMDTPPSEAHDPGRPVLKLHQSAVARIVREIVARTG